MNNRLYIAGRITGDAEAAEKFAKAEEKVRDFAFFDRTGAEVVVRTGKTRYRVVNTCRLTLLGCPLGYYPWGVAMAVCLWKLCGCSTVYMLRDWTWSRGARIENSLAQLLGKRVLYEEDEPREER